MISTTVSTTTDHTHTCPRPRPRTRSSHAWRRLSMVAALLSLSLSAWAHDYRAGDLQIAHPWLRPTVAGQAAGGGFLRIENKGNSHDRLLGATTSATVADHLELHAMTMDGSVMKMREVDAIELPPGQAVELKPGAFHVMFMGLKAPLKEGSKVPVTLKFEKAGELKVNMWVEQPSPTGWTPTTSSRAHSAAP